MNNERLYSVLLAPIVSEKSTMLAEKNNQVAFRVLPTATKQEVKTAVETLFKFRSKAFRSSTARQDEAIWSLRRHPRNDPQGLCQFEGGPGDQFCAGGQLMPLFKVKPTSRGGAPWSRWSTRCCTRQAACIAGREDGARLRPEQPGSDHDPPSGGGHKAPLPDHRFPAQQGWRHRQGGAPGVRPESFGAHCARVLRRWRAPLHHRAEGLASGEIVSGQDAPIRVGNTLPRAQYPRRTTIHCVEMQPGKGAQMARAAGTSVQLLAREGSYAQLRMRSGEISPGSDRLPGDDWRGRQRGKQPAAVRQGGRDALARRAPDRARRGDEPDRPSARRW